MLHVNYKLEDFIYYIFLKFYKHHYKKNCRIPPCSLVVVVYLLLLLLFLWNKFSKDVGLLFFFLRSMEVIAFGIMYPFAWNIIQASWFIDKNVSVTLKNFGSICLVAPSSERKKITYLNSTQYLPYSFLSFLQSFVSLSSLPAHEYSYVRRTYVQWHSNIYKYIRPKYTHRNCTNINRCKHIYVRLYFHKWKKQQLCY